MIRQWFSEADKRAMAIHEDQDTLRIKISRRIS